jgi:hypothetical protein
MHCLSALDDCLTSGRCSTDGAVYNFSGIQCVEPVELMRKDIPDEKWLLYFRGLDKFGNDEPEAEIFP